MPNNNIQASPKIIQFYSDHLKLYGGTAKGVGWKDDASQYIRFEQLFKIINLTEPFTVNDLGCGSGEFYKFIVNQKNLIQYYGYDILEEMLIKARELIKSDNVFFKKIIHANEMNTADYTVASGIFNVRYEITDRDWMDHMIETITIMDIKSRKGFAFNCLSKYSDVDFMKPYLFYTDPLVLFGLCKDRFSKNVALLHDYGYYDFTILVRK